MSKLSELYGFLLLMAIIFALIFIVMDINKENNNIKDELSICQTYNDKIILNIIYNVNENCKLFQKTYEKDEIYYYDDLHRINDTSHIFCCKLKSDDICIKESVITIDNQK